MTEDRTRPEDYLPLTAPAFHVLLSLADGDKHGYAILKEVEHRTDGKVLLSSGTLYAIIKRLLTDGLIQEIEDRGKNGDKRRRCYRLTKFGREVALAETGRMEEMLMGGKARRLLRKPRLA